MRLRKRSLVALAASVALLLALSIGVHAHRNTDPDCGTAWWPEKAALNELLAQPQRWAGEVVEVTGYYSGYPERSILVLAPEAEVYEAATGDAVAMDKIYRDLDGKKLRVTGRFSGPVNRAPFFGGHLCVIRVEAGL
ncbi:hypothetical protein [Xanthomonas axonopodis]|uniref:hypothetical protein n=1 Tax=Xanthomonas axonopodis TaxID=53413 RepID=UPI0011160853|nr:hypothetical protein [Xanthomonas axonopodis]